MTDPEPQSADALIQRAGARCECTGECGANHAFAAGLPAQRCGAPHGCNIRRKLDHPACWVLAELQGWEDNRDLRPSPADADGLVTRGASTWPLAYPELYRKQIVHVLLAPVALPERNAVFCQRCALLLARKES